MMQLIRPSEARKILGISRSTLYAWLDAGILPRPIRLGARATAFRREELEAWLEGRARTTPAGN
jgi:prophage regulatory protein